MKFVLDDDQCHKYRKIKVIPAKKNRKKAAASSFSFSGFVETGCYAAATLVCGLELVPTSEPVPFDLPDCLDTLPWHNVHPSPAWSGARVKQSCRE